MVNKEQIAHFGREPRLFGIRTPGAGPRRDTAVVLANSGIVHRIGANRNTVALARRLAAEGYDTLRFDLSGIGDGPDRTDGLGWEHSSPLELQSAVNAATQFDDASAVVLYGNCGGAAKSFWTAQREPAVRGLLLTNPPPHPADPEFGGEVESFAHGHLLARDAVPDPAGDLVTLLDRGVRMLFVFAEGDTGERFYYARLADRVRPYLADGRLTVATVPHTNHTFASVAARDQLLDLSAQWLCETFPGRGDVAETDR